jgi:hypothetical protein
MAAADAGGEDITAATVVTGTVIMVTGVTAVITGTVTVGTMGTGATTVVGIRRFILELASVIQPTDTTAIRLTGTLTPLPPIPRTVTIQPNRMRRPQSRLAEAPRRP